MTTPTTPTAPSAAPLQRRFGLLHATALNMINMIGIGPFITIPLLMTALGGPQAMLGWVVALVIVICDGMIWSELGAAMPHSGGSFGYLREAFGRERLGRLMAFLFVWQFILSGPLEIASGYIGFSQYLGYIWPSASPRLLLGVAAVVGLLNIALLYRRITSIAKITVSLWVGTLLTTAAVIATGALHFDPKVAFDFPPGAFTFSLGFLLGLGAASRVGVYDYLGYYDICYIGDEVENPGRVIPRSILISTLAVAVIYFVINLSIIGVVPWREFVPADAHPQSAFIVSIFMEKIYGPNVATVFTLMVLWTAFGSVFALLLGYSRIPYAAARDGYFFAPFARLHPTAGFPTVSLIVLGVIAIAACLFSLGRRHRRADRDADPGAVHRPDRRCHAAAPGQPGDAAAVPHLAVPGPGVRRARRLDVHLPDDRRAGHRVRAGAVAARGGGFRGVVAKLDAARQPPV